MFGSYGGAVAATALTFVSGTSLAKGIGAKLRISKPLVAVENTRGGLRKASMIHNGATPALHVDPETYAVTADGVLLTCPARDGAADGAALFSVLREAARRSSV